MNASERDAGRDPNRARMPADVDAPDKIMYGLTFRQIAILAVAGVVFYGAWKSLRHLVPQPALLVAGVVLGVLAFGLVVGRRDGLSLDRWLWHAFTHSRAPKALSTVDTTTRVPEWVEQPPKVWIVLDEAVIRRVVGGTKVFAAQLERVAEVGALPHVDIQVMPFAVGAHPGTPGSFVVLKFPEPTDPPVVYIETMAGDLYPESQDDISDVILAFDRLRAMALGPDDSATLIQKVAKELT